MTQSQTPAAVVADLDLPLVPRTYQQTYKDRAAIEAYGQACIAAVAAALARSAAPAPLDLSKHNGLKRFGMHMTEDGNFFGAMPDGPYINLADVQSLLAAQPPAKPEAAPQAEQQRPTMWTYDMQPPPGFVDYVRKNYTGEVFFHDPDWHAMRLWNAAMRNANVSISASLPDVAMPEPIAHVVRIDANTGESIVNAALHPGTALYLAAQPDEGSAEVCSGCDPAEGFCKACRDAEGSALVAKAEPTFMNDEKAQEWAWKQVKKDVGTEGWTAGESCTYYGFFLWGWRYRAQYERQRPERAAPERSDTPAEDTLILHGIPAGCAVQVRVAADLCERNDYLTCAATLRAIADQMQPVDGDKQGAQGDA